MSEIKIMFWIERKETRRVGQEDTTCWIRHIGHAAEETARADAQQMLPFPTRIIKVTEEILP